MIRPFKKDDTPHLLQIIQKNTPKYFAPFEKEEYRMYLENDIEYYFVFEEEGILKAGGGYNLNNDGSISISWDLVDPAFQGGGIGAKLINYRLERIKSQHKTDRVIVRTSQLTYEFYQKMGFSLKEVKKDYWWEGLDLYFMDLNLK